MDSYEITLRNILNKIMLIKIYLARLKGRTLSENQPGAERLR